MIANILDYFPKIRQIKMDFSLIGPVPNQVAQNAAEVLVTRVGQERAAVCQHTDEVSQNSAIGKIRQLLSHTALVVI